MPHFKRLKAISGKLAVISGVLLFPLTVAAEEVWTLESSVQQVVKISPRILAADAEIDARKGALSQAGAWPNPTIEIGGSEALGLEDGKGGSDLTSFSVSQPIPLGRLIYQRKQATAELQVANHKRFYQQLLQENLASRRFHDLQLTEAGLNLAKEQLSFANRYQKGKKDSDRLVRYLSKLDKKRLNIIREIAKQNVASAEGAYSEALSNFRVALNLPQDSSSKIAPLEAVQIPKALLELLDLQNESHAAIAAAKHNKNAAEASVSLARNKRFPDPSLTLYREKDFLNGQRQNFTGVMVNFTVPIWDFNNGNISRAKADANRAGHELEALERDLQATLRQTHLHLGHVIEQAEHYRSRILGPAKDIFTLTQKSFATGEVKILSLVDANDTYFEARKRYLELLYESWVEAADLRLAAGLSLKTDAKTIIGE